MGEPTTLTPVTDRAPFSMHPEDWVTQQESHDEQTAYFKHGLRLLLPDCFVARDLAVYWVPGQTQHPYVGPDVFVSRQRPRVEDPRAWLTYEDGPLALVIEVASEGTRHKEEEKRDATYAQLLQVPEYGDVDLQRGELRLGRLVDGRYEWIGADEVGRVWSELWPVGFLWREEERFVRLVAADGTVVLTPREAVARAEREARRAEREARRADRETQRRAAAERQARELAAEVERLRRRLGEGSPGDGSS